MATELVPVGQPYGDRQRTTALARVGNVPIDSPPIGGGPPALPARPNPLRPGAEVPDDPLLALTPQVPVAPPMSVADQLTATLERASNPLIRLAAARLRERS